MENKIIKKVTLICVSVIIVVFILLGIQIYIKSEMLYEKYVNDGDKWICKSPMIELTYYSSKKIGYNTYGDLTMAEIEGVDSEVIIASAGGHSKNWDFIYLNDNSEPILTGEYEIKDENTLIFHVSKNSPSNIAKPDSDLVFKKIAYKK